MDRLLSLARKRWHPLAIVMIAVGVPLALVHALVGTPDGFSAYYNLAWAEGFDAAFWAGDAYPRRLDTLLDGAGGLDFYFYGPLPFWLNATVGRALCGGCSAVEAFPLTGALLVLCSGPAFYALARRFAAPLASAVGAAVYMLLPYHLLVDWWVRQAVGEVAAYIFMPLLILGMKRILDGERGAILFALALAGLVLSHLPSTLIMAYVLGLYGLIHVWQRRARPWALVPPVLALGCGGMLGLGLSALYWLPALTLLADVSPGMLYTAYADPLNWLFFDGRPAPNPRSAYLASVLCLAAIGVAVLAYATLKRERSPMLGWIFGPIAFGAFMMSALSAPVWAFTPISAIQFPWRTLMIVDIGLAFAAIAFADRLLRSRAAISLTVHAVRRARRGALAAVAIVALAVGLVMPAVQAAGENPHRGNQVPIATGALEYIPAPFLTKVREAVDALPTPAPGTNIYVHWHEGIKDAVQGLRFASAETTTYLYVDPVDTRQLNLDLERRGAGDIVLPYPYWRHWQVIDRANGNPLPTFLHPESGGVAFEGEAGRMEIALVLAPTPAERWGAFLTVFALALLLALAARDSLAVPERDMTVAAPKAA